MDLVIQRCDLSRTQREDAIRLTCDQEGKNTAVILLWWIASYLRVRGTFLL
jgi:hypothetical protein